MPDAAHYTLGLFDSTALGWALRPCPNNVVLLTRVSVSPSASVRPTVPAEHSLVLRPPVLISCERTVPSLSVNSTMTRHFIPLPRSAVSAWPIPSRRFETVSSLRRGHAVREVFVGSVSCCVPGRAR